jgi:hypothetical protein
MSESKITLEGLISEALNGHINKPVNKTFVFNDGGAKEAGFKGRADDCVCRSFAIVSGKSYNEVADLIKEFSKRERKSKRKRNKSTVRSGVYKATVKKVAEALDLVWTPTMSIGSGCTVHLRSDELPSGTIAVNCSLHVTAMIDGVIHDTHDPSRNGTRCVYGYWSKQS